MGRFGNTSNQPRFAIDVANTPFEYTIAYTFETPFPKSSLKFLFSTLMEYQKRVANEYYHNIEITIRDGPESYEERAGFFSKILFCWLNPLMETGYKRALESTDLPQLS